MNLLYLKKVHSTFMLCLCLFLNLNFVFSQQEINTSFATETNNVFGTLEANRVPHSILLDYGMHFIKMDSYQGLALTDSNYINTDVFREIYHTLITSRIEDDTTGFVHPDTLVNRFNSARTARKITLTGLFFDYSQFKPTAYSENLITISNGKLYDKYVNGIWQNPYEEKEAFAITPSLTVYPGEYLDVHLPANLWFTNNSSGISSMEIDFDDGQGYQTLSFDQEIGVQYTDTGSYDWKYKIIKTDNSELVSHSKFVVEEAPVEYLNQPPSGQGARIIGDCNPVIPISGGRQVCEVEADEILPGKFFPARGFITIDYADGNTSIEQPLIVVEGLGIMVT